MGAWTFARGSGDGPCRACRRSHRGVPVSVLLLCSAFSRLTDGIADVVYSFVLQLLLLLQVPARRLRALNHPAPPCLRLATSLFSNHAPPPSPSQSVLVLWIPPTYFGMLLSLVYSSWLTSLYCFEYTWLNAGWSLNRRLNYFERHWAYFLGFGLPFTAATYFLSFLYR